MDKSLTYTEHIEKTLKKGKLTSQIFVQNKTEPDASCGRNNL